MFPAWKAVDRNLWMSITPRVFMWKKEDGPNAGNTRTVSYVPAHRYVVTLICESAAGRRLFNFLLTEFR